MRYRAFVPYSILGTGLWVSSAIVLGYFFSRNINSVIDYAGKGAFALGALIVIVVGIVALRRHLRVEENRRAAVRWMEAHAATRWLVRLGRRFGPQLGFLWDRVTPGGTFGLEFTTLMATLAVSLFVLIAYTVIVNGEPGPTPGDTTALEFVEHIQVDWLVHLAKVVTALGSAAVVLPLALLCGGFLAWPRALGRGRGAGRRPGADRDRRARDQGRGRPAAPGRRPGRHLRLLVPEPPRRLLDLLRLALADDRRAPAARDGARRGGDRGRHRARRPDRPLARLPRRPLPQRRQRRLGARGRLLLALRGGRAGRHHVGHAAQWGRCAAPGAAEDRK